MKVIHTFITCEKSARSKCCDSVISSANVFKRRKGKQVYRLFKDFIRMQILGGNTKRYGFILLCCRSTRLEQDHCRWNVQQEKNRQRKVQTRKIHIQMLCFWIGACNPYPQMLHITRCKNPWNISWSKVSEMLYKSHGWESVEKSRRQWLSRKGSIFTKCLIVLVYKTRMEVRGQRDLSSPWFSQSRAISEVRQSNSKSRLLTLFPKDLPLVHAGKTLHVDISPPSAGQISEKTCLQEHKGCFCSSPVIMSKFLQSRQCNYSRHTWTAGFCGQGRIIPAGSYINGVFSIPWVLEHRHIFLGLTVFAFLIDSVKRTNLQHWL